MTTQLTATVEAGPRRRWDVLVMVGSAYVGVVGLALTAAPGPMRRIFDAMIFGTATPAVVGGEAEAFLEFVYAILGASLVGWSVLLLAVVRGSLARRSRRAWWWVALSVAAWFVPDTLRSVLTHPENAVFNLTFAIPIAIGLAGMWGELRDDVHPAVLSVRAGDAPDGSPPVQDAR